MGDGAGKANYKRGKCDKHGGDHEGLHDEGVCGLFEGQWKEVELFEMVCVGGSRVAGTIEKEIFWRDGKGLYRQSFCTPLKRKLNSVNISLAQ